MELRVDKYSTVTYRQNRYSVPEGHVGEYIKLKARAEEILIFIEGECIAKYKRIWQIHTWVMDIYHYLKTFEKKKGALAQSECLSQAPKEIKNCLPIADYSERGDALSCSLKTDVELSNYSF